MGDRRSEKGRAPRGGAETTGMEKIIWSGRVRAKKVIRHSFPSVRTSFKHQFSTTPTTTIKSFVTSNGVGVDEDKGGRGKGEEGEAGAFEKIPLHVGRA